MGKDPNNRRDEGAQRLRPSRLAWLPIPILFGAMAVLWAAALPGSYESPYLLLALNFVFSTLVSLFVAYLVGRSFLVRSTPGLLLLGCGVIFWGLASVVATVVAHGDVNITITIHNSCVWLSALCHLVGVVLSLRPKQPLSPTSVWLVAAYLHAAAPWRWCAGGARGLDPNLLCPGSGRDAAAPACADLGYCHVCPHRLVAERDKPQAPICLRLLVRPRPDADCSWTVRCDAPIVPWQHPWLDGPRDPTPRRPVHAHRGGGLRGEFHVWGISLEEALREERDFSAAVLDTAGVLVVVFDAQGRITRFNRACERLTGYPAAEVLGRTCRGFLIPPDELAGVMAGWEAIHAGDIPIRHENHWLTRAGKRRLIDWSITALTDKTGEVCHVIAIGIDITDQRRAEEALRELNATLESKSRPADGGAAASGQAAPEVDTGTVPGRGTGRRRIAVILHEDLQQQIAGARFHLNLVRNRARDDRQRTDVEHVDEMLKEAIEKSRSLSHDLSPAVLHMNDLAEVLQWLANRVRASMVWSLRGCRGRDDSAIGSDDDVPVPGGPGNAVQCGQARGGQGGRHPSATDRTNVCLCVSDQGRGFDPQELKETSGFGLLSIRERVELLGGRMKISSAKGQGSRFRVVVPDGPK